MKRQTLLGLLLLCLGVMILAAVCGPALAAVLRGAESIPLSIAPLLTGVGLTVFGAWLLPSSGVGETTINILTVAGPYLPFGRRVASGEVQAPPQDGAK